MQAGKKLLQVIWILSVLAAVFVALPMLALMAMIVAPVMLASLAEAPLEAVLVVAWIAAGTAGLAGRALVLPRNAGIGRLRTAQALLAAGIVAALAAVVAVLALRFEIGPAVLIVGAFVVLILDGIARIHALEARAAKLVDGVGRLRAAALAMASIAGLSAIVGHLAL